MEKKRESEKEVRITLNLPFPFYEKLYAVAQVRRDAYLQDFLSQGTAAMV